MTEIEQAMQRVIDGDFIQGFADLAKAFTREDQKDAAVVEDLKQGFWKPNLEEMEETYKKNVLFLEGYPFLLTKKFIAPQDNRYLLFPLTEQLFYRFDQRTQTLAPMETSSERETRYFFETLERPIMIESEYNGFNLRFLRDNVRKSEDFAGDNHVYLCYADADEFSLLLYYSNLEELCKDNKFVFLIGTERRLYPLDFKARFGIDYGAMKGQKLRIEEMQRICFWYKRGYCGTLLGLDVLDHNPNIVSWFAVDLYYDSCIKGSALYTTNLPKDILADLSHTYTLHGLKALLHHPDFQWGIDDMADFIRWLEAERITSFTLPELFRAYYIFKFYKTKSDTNPRIVPVILFEPHLNETDLHNSLVLDFPYVTVLNAFRDPVKTAGRIFQREGSIFITQILSIGYFMHPELRKQYYSYRFEDLKLQPEETCKVLCELLNVPYDPYMLDAEGTVEVEGEPLARGFDPISLHRNIDSAFSPFDQVRLQIFYDSILRHYGYPAFDFSECPMDDDDIAFLFKFPFKCEKEYVEKARKEQITSGRLRRNLFQGMVTLWEMGKSGELVFPKVIYPKSESHEPL